MKLSVLASGSRGNCYVIQNKDEALIIECGVRMSVIKKSLNFDISKVVGVLISHEHL